MAEADEVWLLRCGDEVAAELHVSEHDFPWLRARVRRGPAFGRVADLFAEEAHLLEVLSDEETAEWTAAYERIRAETALCYPDGRLVPEYLLHIDGDEAWWRWSDEPFEVF